MVSGILPGREAHCHRCAIGGWEPHEVDVLVGRCQAECESLPLRHCSLFALGLNTCFFGRSQMGCSRLFLLHFRLLAPRRAKCCFVRALPNGLLELAVSAL